GEVIQQMAREAGFTISLRPQEFASALKDDDDGKLQAFQIGWSGRVDPDGNIHMNQTCKGSLNATLACDEKIDALLNRAREISDLVFAGGRMIPGDPARVMAGTDADAAGLEEIRAKYGLNDPIPVQYLRWAGLALQGDLGRSIRTRDPVMTTVARKLPITVE